MSIYLEPTHGVLTDDFLARAEKLWRQAVVVTRGDAVASYNVRMGAFSIDYTRLERQRMRERSEPGLASTPEGLRKREWAERVLACLDEAGDIRLAEDRGRDPAMIKSWCEQIGDKE